jgi:hypothetical protein
MSLLATSKSIRLSASLWLAALACGQFACKPQESAPVARATSNDYVSPFSVAPATSRDDATPLLEEEAPSPGCPSFIDVHEAAGIRHVYQNGARGESLMVESIGGGAGWLDYDADGLPDLYLTQGGDPTRVDTTGQPTDQLYRNLGDGQFRNVTEATWLRETRYSQGVAVGDFDNDGFDDIYVTNVGRNSLFQNQGDGTFLDVTDQAGVGDERWSSSAAWADLDQDGDLDLYVCNYVQYDPLHPLDCRNAQGEARICHPRDVEHWPDECYINQGDGTFRPEAKERGLEGPGNKALGVAVADFNNDGAPDIYIANDTTPNFLFMNQGEGKYLESAVLLGCAVDRNGASQASMGLAVGDYDRNGWLDIYSTHFYEESNTLYRNLGPQGFDDITALAGLHQPTLPFLAFGTVMADFDQNGTQELIVANGHIENYPGNPIYEMTPQLFSYHGSRWEECSRVAGDFFQQKRVARGMAVADYDTDGDPDVVVVHQNAPAALLQNSSQRGNWLTFRLLGHASNRRGIGARITVETAGGTWIQELCGGTSFASSHQPTLFFGLGEAPEPCKVTIRWPSGHTQVLENVLPDQALFVEETR